jgi:hypothetical protein
VFVATIIVSAVLALALTASAAGKATRQAAIVDGITGVGVPERRVPLLAIPLLAGAVGLVVGLWVEPIGIAAAACLVLYFVLAVGAHLRARDPNFAPPAALGLISVAALVLRALSA